MVPELPSDFFTLESVLTLGGAATAVVVVSNTIRQLLGWKSLWVGFSVSLVIVIFGALSADRPLTLGTAVLVFLNSCLLFCTAFGIHESGAGFARRRSKASAAPEESPAGKPDGWATSWVGT